MLTSSWSFFYIN